MEKKILYMVMRLNTNVTVGNAEIGECVEKIAGIAGFLPVYDTLEQAQEAAENRKFEIVLISAISVK